MPPSLLERVRVEKHLAGQHDQKSHGNWAHGGAWRAGVEATDTRGARIGDKKLLSLSDRPEAPPGWTRKVEYGMTVDEAIDKLELDRTQLATRPDVIEMLNEMYDGSPRLVYESTTGGMPLKVGFENGLSTYHNTTGASAFLPSEGIAQALATVDRLAKAYPLPESARAFDEQSRSEPIQIEFQRVADAKGGADGLTLQTVGRIMIKEQALHTGGITPNHDSWVPEAAHFSNNLDHIITHEWAHLLQPYDNVWPLRSLFAAHGAKISQYAATSYQEAYAEAFAAFVHGSVREPVIAYADEFGWTR